MKLYTTNCPKCKVIEQKLEVKGLNYIKVEDIEEMKKLNILSVPVLEIDGCFYDFVNAVKYINEEL